MTDRDSARHLKIGTYQGWLVVGGRVITGFQDRCLQPLGHPSVAR